MKEVFVTADDQLDSMENFACATGSKSYDEAWDAMYSELRAQYGRDVSFDFEEIPEARLKDFTTWLEEDDE